MPPVTSEPGRHQAAGSDACAVEDVRAVADQRLLADDGTVHDAQVGDRRTWADLAGDVRRRCSTAPSWTLAPGADDDRPEVGAEHGAVPDRGAGLDADVAHERGGRRDERVVGDGGTDTFEGVERHGASLGWARGEESSMTHHHRQPGDRPDPRPAGCDPSLRRSTSRTGSWPRGLPPLPTSVDDFRTTKEDVDAIFSDYLPAYLAGRDAPVPLVIWAHGGLVGQGGRARRRRPPDRLVAGQRRVPGALRVGDRARRLAVGRREGPPPRAARAGCSTTRSTRRSRSSCDTSRAHAPPGAR